MYTIGIEVFYFIFNCSEEIKPELRDGAEINYIISCQASRISLR